MIIHPILKPYIVLLEDFYNLKILHENFHDDYMELWKKDRDKYYQSCKLEDTRLVLTDSIQELLNRIFTTLDCYCPDPELRDEHDLDDEQMREEVLTLYEELKQLIQEQYH